MKDECQMATVCSNAGSSETFITPEVDHDHQAQNCQHSRYINSQQNRSTSSDQVDFHNNNMKSNSATQQGNINQSAVLHAASTSSASYCSESK